LRENYIPLRADLVSAKQKIDYRVCLMLKQSGMGMLQEPIIDDVMHQIGVIVFSTYLANILLSL